MKNNSNKESGYTVIELGIVVSIMIIMMGVVFANYRTGSDSLLLQGAASQVSADIRRAQSSAGVESSGCSNPNYKMGFGIKFDYSNATKAIKYILFADCNGNQTFDSGIDIQDLISLAKGVAVCGLSIPDTPIGTKADIVFVPPDPFVYIENSRNSNPLSIKICLEKDPTKYKSIILNKAGMIDISN